LSGNEIYLFSGKEFIHKAIAIRFKRDAKNIRKSIFNSMLRAAV